jgi:uncharacterized membrane protein
VAALQGSSRRIWWWVLGVAIAIAVGYGIWLLIYVANSENTLDRSLFASATGLT